MKKRVFAGLLALCIALGILPPLVLAEEREIENTYTVDSGIMTMARTGSEISYPVTGGNIYFNESTGAITYCDGTVTAANIPAQIAGTNVTAIGDHAFAYCNTLTSITLPNSITSIGEWGFWECNGLTDFQIPDGVTFIGEGAFAGCHELTSITIPNSVSTVEAGPFRGCTKLTSIQTAPDNTRFTSIDGVLFNKSVTELVQYPGGKNISYDIPSSVTVIASDAFDGCNNIPGITLPEGITTIESFAFSYCFELTSFIIPSSVKSIDYGAFAFCDSLTGITIPAGVTSLAVDLFLGCSALNSVTIPSSISSLEEGAFYACDKLSEVYYAGTKANWAAISIDNYNDPLKRAVIHCSDGDIMPEDGAPGDSTSLIPGIKYVPYSCWAEDANYSIAPDTAAGNHYELAEGSILPSGLSLSQDGVISGVPMADGTWNFQIRLTSQGNDVEESELLPRSLTILDNTDSAVQRPNDYDIIIHVGIQDKNNQNHFYKNEYTQEILKIAGPYDEFRRLLIDGKELTQPDDYTAEEGSTVITIHTETFQRFGEGTHTIAAEFRPSNNPSQVKRVAQNYTLRLSRPSSSGSGSGGRSKPSINKDAQKPQQPQGQQETIPFADVAATEWYYEDVVWAYQEGLMQGVDGTHFGPDEKVSQATIVTVLARLAKIDLSQFNGETEPNVPAGQYYTAAAIWAKRAGLMPSGGTFTGSEVTTRNQMAVMLTKYLASMGKDTTPPAQPIAFDDAGEMSQEGNAAFQTLYQCGIFKGTGGMNMEPNGSTTRAQFVALMHRIYDTAVS